MGILGMPATMPDVDFFGTPEYFVTRTWFEPAGIGCVRVFAVCERNGQTIPLYTAVMEVSDMMTAGKEAAKTSEQVVSLQRLMSARQGH